MQATSSDTLSNEKAIFKSYQFVDLGKCPKQGHFKDGEQKFSDYITSNQFLLLVSRRYLCEQWNKNAHKIPATRNRIRNDCFSYIHT